ncbi:sensor histidine kinase [Enterococcus alcedinis]|uniref:Histidine kinase n=1 Tax=Enterococcus alcedinis TaxID=1274384 RepID=A0A917N5F6_9ENTE|nr:GHKL domain-containing protein [Enterococcus alcedinis]MBP2102701.1 sensor histidine kinase regulating citrate/malate metabolism [Enterococcus alcedinis]GGI66261.1 histidine kinase [Enterococcus alcedinis]
MIFKNRAKQQLEIYQAELLETHYAEVENMYQQMRGWRHDYRNHIQGMKAYVAMGDLTRLDRYLTELDENLSKVELTLKTGNKMADAILNSKISLAKSKNIQVIADANIPFTLSISEIDFCVLLGNLFDNAIEASLALEENERLIRLYMELKGTQLYLSFTNFTALKKQSKWRGRFKTTKGENRGLGLVQIEQVVKKLEGYIHSNSEDGAFTTEILLPQEVNHSAP